MSNGGDRTDHVASPRSKQPRLSSPNQQLPDSAIGRLGVTLGGWPVVAIATAGLLTWALSRNTPDAWIGANVKMALIASDQVGGVPIGTDARDGRVTLHGAVRTETEREEAIRVASRIRGVRGVRDLLVVVPLERRRALRRDDERLKRRIERALGGDRETAGLDVKSVNAGVVLLAGRVASFPTQLRALEAASLVPGVRRVASEIRSPDALSDDEVWYEDGQAGEAPEAQVEHADAWITGHTQLRFLGDPEIFARDINVDTHNGRVTLFGLVPTQKARSAAQRIAGDVPGVRTIQNDLRIVPAAHRDSAIQADDALRSEVERRIAERLPASAISVRVRAAQVRLTGVVDRAADRFAAMMLAHSTDGVRGVSCDVRVHSE